MAARHTSLVGMFYPKSIAVVGASRERKKLGHIILRNIIDSGYEGDVWGINPHAHQILGKRIFESYEKLPKPADLAILAIPAQFVLDTLRVIGIKGTRYVVVITAGFKEIGEEGLVREQNMLDIAKEYGMTILGPNCLGFLNMYHGLNATFGQAVENKGNLRFISQSGAIASSLFDWARQSEVGFDTFVTLGNKAQLGENELLDYWLHDDPRLEAFDEKKEIAQGYSGYAPVGMYLESIEDGEQFIELASKMARQHPVFVLKPGKSEGAAKAMQSHTGSLTGADVVFEEALQEAGVIRCGGVEDLFDLCRVFAWERAPKGNSVVVVSNAGGPAVLAADAVAASGLTLAKITHEAHEIMEQALPLAASLHNPVDVLGDALADRYEQAMRAVIASRDVHALIVILTPQVMTEIEQTAAAVTRVSKEFGKPIVCAFMGGSAIEAGERVLSKHKIPSFRYPERAIWALGRMWWWYSHHHLPAHAAKSLPRLPGLEKRESVGDLFARVLLERRTILTSLESQEVLGQWGIRIPEFSTVENLAEAEAFVHAHGWPMVLKLSSPKLLHKIEHGGVALNIRDVRHLEMVIEAMQDRVAIMRAHGDESAAIEIQRQVDHGLEVIVGIKRDPTFGPVMMFGAGGTWAEIFADRNLKLLPLSEDGARALVERSKVYQLLAGYRGEQQYAIEELIRMLLQLSSLVSAYPEISEIEINPVIVTHERVWAVDGKVILG